MQIKNPSTYTKKKTFTSCPIQNIHKQKQQFFLQFQNFLNTKTTIFNVFLLRSRGHWLIVGFLHKAFQGWKTSEGNIMRGGWTIHLNNIQIGTCPQTSIVYRRRNASNDLRSFFDDCYVRSVDPSTKITGLKSINPKSDSPSLFSWILIGQAPEVCLLSLFAY